MMFAECHGRTLPEPWGMHPDATHGPGFSIIVIAEADTYCVRWCCRNKCGGVYSRSQNRWTLRTPITFPDFLELLKSEGIVPAEVFDSWEMRRWIKANKLASGEMTE